MNKYLFILISLVMYFSTNIAFAQTAKVEVCVGNVNIKVGNNVYKAKVGVTVKEGWIVMTGNKSLVKLVTQDGDAITIKPMSKFELKSMSSGKTSSDLKYGEVRCQVKSNANKRFGVNTPSCQIGCKRN